MAGKVISYDDVLIQELRGRDLCMMITEDTVGSKKMSGGVLWMKPRAVVKPCHAHLNGEEVIYIIKGEGKVWIDGEIAEVKTGNCVFFPMGSKHMLKNTGKTIMQVFFIYSPPTDPSEYEYYPEIDFPCDS